MRRIYAVAAVLLVAGCTPSKYIDIAPVDIERGGWPYRVWAKRTAEREVEVLVQQTAFIRSIDALEIRREYRAIGSQYAASLCGSDVELIDGADLVGELSGGFDMHFRCR